MRLPALVLGLALFAAGRASAQPDAQLRWPSLTRGDLVLVRGTAVIPHLEAAVGLDADLVRRPIVLVDRALDRSRDAVGTRLTTTLLYGVGIEGHSQLALAVPIAWQQGKGRAPLTRDPRDGLEAGAAGDLRLDFAHALTPGCGAARSGRGGVLLASGVVVPTGDGRSFAGGGGAAAYVEAAGTGRLGALALAASWGIRARRGAELAGEAVGTELSIALGAAVELLEARLVLAAEAQALVGLRRGAATPVLALVEGRARFGAWREAEVALGLGRGLGEALRAPALEVVLSLRSIPGGGRATRSAHDRVREP